MPSKQVFLQIYVLNPRFCHPCCRTCAWRSQKYLDATLLEHAADHQLFGTPPIRIGNSQNAFVNSAYVARQALYTVLYVFALEVPIRHLAAYQWGVCSRTGRPPSPPATTTTSMSTLWTTSTLNDPQKKFIIAFGVLAQSVLIFQVRIAAFTPPSQAPA